MEYVNNHIHTTYSFSPYTPAQAVQKAKDSGLVTAGIMDHDTVAGAEEFAEAGKRIGIATTVGFECRCSLKGTAFESRRVNNPDQDGGAYLAMHGIPRQGIAKAQEFLRPFREKRNVRNRKMVGNINATLGKPELALDFERDVLPISEYANGGSVTERHLLYALALKMADGMEAYRLLNGLKANLVEKIYVPATDELPTVKQFVDLAKELGAISAYAYLGDVGDSVTGDKKAQGFEDAYLGELFAYLQEMGFNAVTYMPTRNTPAQLARVSELCGRMGFFEVSGEDINSPLQSFICKALEKPQFKHLITNTWALIGHERAASEDPEDGMFSAKTIAGLPGLTDRIRRYEGVGRALGSLA
jgi:hypothetical protein